MRWMVWAPVALVAGCSGGGDGVPQNATAVEREPVPAPIAPADTPPPPTSADNVTGPPAAPAETDDYVGRWIGVEGMYLVVSKRPQGGFSLEMQYDLDNKGRFEGVAVDRSTPGGPGIAFLRDGRTETLRPTDGDATGLKYLAGKTDCLTVKPGEGYCRD